MTLLWNCKGRGFESHPSDMPMDFGFTELGKVHSSIQCLHTSVYVCKTKTNKTVFVSCVQPPVRAKLKKSLLTNLSKAVGEVRKGGHQDVDEYFQKERATVNDLVKLMKEASDNFNNLLNHEESKWPNSKVR